MTSRDCRVLRSDTSEAANPVPGLWGSLDCVSVSRYRYVRGHGDRSRTATGRRQHNDAYRRLKVMGGDNLYGQRCELGRNDSEFGENRGTQSSGTFALYGQGEHAITFVSEKYPESFSTSVRAWQTVMQMKQVQPYDSTLGSGPMIELQIFGNRLRLQNDWQQVWTTHAPTKNRWIRYALDVVYSQDPDVGSVKVYADLNGDGDALDAGEQSPIIHMATLLTETDGPNGTSDGLGPGDAIPDHLRVGLYDSPAIACPPPYGCGMYVDNVQVVAPKR
jgi:Polysaccharide lyase